MMMNGERRRSLASNHDGALLIGANSSIAIHSRLFLSHILVRLFLSFFFKI
jgi:hypothetical protein